MPTVDQEIYDAAVKFVDGAVEKKKPFFLWFNTTRMHVWTRLEEELEGKTGMLIPMAWSNMTKWSAKCKEARRPGHRRQHHRHLLDRQREAHWPDGGSTPFFGEKGTTWEGGSAFHCLCVGRRDQPGVNNIIHEDWMPTLLAAAGDPDVVKKVADGYKVGDKTSSSTSTAIISCLSFRQGRQEPAHEIFYFDQGGNLNAVRYDDWKVSFAITEGAINTAYRKTPAGRYRIACRPVRVAPMTRCMSVGMRTCFGSSCRSRRSRKVRSNSQGVSAGQWWFTERWTELPSGANATGP